MPNRLSQETSPYLRQHAENPVDWHPWGQEAISRAQGENKPIFLSIGYAACHWCHVMEHESFMDQAIAQFLNENFINIKVDREERPDIDHIYMSAVTAMTGHGGWPMSVFLTPELHPFYTGTYFPPSDRHGLPSFKRVLEAIARSWKEKQEEIIGSGRNITHALRERIHVGSGSQSLDTEKLFAAAVRSLNNAFDPDYGGFGFRPKFPHPMEIRLLLRLSHRNEDSELMKMACLSLDKVARGGIYDQLAGGFHRYSTDEKWLVPHFEKMLYDNALLVPAYLEAWQLTGNAYFCNIAEETLGWVMRDMTSPEGAFYSTTDADSEGEEGKYFVWSEAEIKTVLGDDAEFFCSLFDVSETGNWEETNILHRPKTDDQEIKLNRHDPDSFQARVKACKEKLLKVRASRVPPGRDEKLLCSWNALMISAFAFAGKVLSCPKYTQTAANAARFLLDRMRQPNGLLFRTAGMGEPAKLNAYLEDYAFLLDALIELFQADGNTDWLQEAKVLADHMIHEFSDDIHGGFFFTGKQHETLILRDYQAEDNAIPSGNSMAIQSLVKLSVLLDEPSYHDRAESALKLFSSKMFASPMAYSQMIAAWDWVNSPIELLVLVRGADMHENQDLEAGMNRRYRPRSIMAIKHANSGELSCFRNREAVGNKPTLFRCFGTHCDSPIIGAQAIQASLAVAAN